MRTVFVLPIVCALALAGCATTGSTPGAPAGSVTSIVTQVQRVTRQVCGFVPVAKTIVGIFSAGGGSALGIAQEICNAVTNNPMTEGPRGGRTVPKVRGVAVRGQFVR